MNIWGIEVSIDLKGCDEQKIRDKGMLRGFLIEISKQIKVKRFGDPIIVDFGEDERIAGFSIVQLIESSLISGHFVNKTNAAYINIFSCSSFDPVKAANCSKQFFQAASMEFIVNYRHI